MTPPLRVRLLDPNTPTWREDCAALIPAGGAPDAAQHLPLHFCQVTLPRLDGAAYQILEGDRVIAYGYLLPRQRTANNRKVFTVRHHTVQGTVHGADSVSEAALNDLLRDALEARHGVVYLQYYDPAASHHYTESHRILGPVDIGRPSEAEAQQIPALHQRVWGSASNALYPADLASDDYGAGSALVARVEGHVVGFLLGFFKFGGSSLPADWNTTLDGGWRLESQIMGVLQEYRGLRIANLLKRVQAEQAVEAGVQLINWTADPLQYPNAALNFGLLRAVAFDFYPDLYPFRNELNRVAASRFGITWLIGSARVTDTPIVGARASVLDLSSYPDVEVVNEGTESLLDSPSAEVIAIEVPADWTRMQAEEPALAQEWRTLTDNLFGRLVGKQPGQYVVTGVAIRESRRYLLLEAATNALWARLAQK